MAEMLTPLQERFVEEYVKNNGNERKAALDAGYSQSVADHAGREILRSPAVKTAIDERLKEIRDLALVRLGMNLNNVLDELIAMALSPDTPATAKERALCEVLDRAGILAGPARLEFAWNASQENGLDAFLAASQREEPEG